MKRNKDASSMGDTKTRERVKESHLILNVNPIRPTRSRNVIHNWTTLLKFPHHCVCFPCSKSASNNLVFENEAHTITRLHKNCTQRNFTARFLGLHFTSVLFYIATVTLNTDVLQMQTFRLFVCDSHYCLLYLRNVTTS